MSAFATLFGIVEPTVDQVADGTGFGLNGTEFTGTLVCSVTPDNDWEICITNQSGEPTAGIEVRISTSGEGSYFAAAITGADGRASFNLSPGSYTAFVYLAGNLIQSRTFDVGP